VRLCWCGLCEFFDIAIFDDRQKLLGRFFGLFFGLRGVVWGRVYFSSFCILVFLLVFS